MIPVNPWEYQNAIKALYAKCVGSVCLKHGLTRMELDILLFLSNNPCFDTATEIVDIRYLSKSQVSSAIRLLREKGYIRKEYARENKKTAHLKLCKTSCPAIADGRAAQENFVRILMREIPEEEVESMKRCMEHIRENIDRYLKEDLI